MYEIYFEIVCIYVCVILPRMCGIKDDFLSILPPCMTVLQQIWGVFNQCLRTSPARNISNLITP